MGVERIWEGQPLRWIAAAPQRAFATVERTEPVDEHSPQVEQIAAALISSAYVSGLFSSTLDLFSRGNAAPGHHISGGLDHSILPRIDALTWRSNLRRNRNHRVTAGAVWTILMVSISTCSPSRTLISGIIKS